MNNNWFIVIQNIAGDFIPSTVFSDPNEFDNMKLFHKKRYHCIVKAPIINGVLTIPKNELLMRMFNNNELQRVY
jgi:hypothetical protein